MVLGGFMSFLVLVLTSKVDAYSVLDFGDVLFIT